MAIVLAAQAARTPTRPVITATATGTSTISIALTTPSVEPVSGIALYALWRSVGGAAFTLIQDVAPSAFPFVDTNLPSNTMVSYYAEGINKSPNKDASLPSVTTTATTQASAGVETPTPPVISAVAQSSSSILVSLVTPSSAPIYGVTNYLLQRSVAGSAYSTIATLAPTVNPSPSGSTIPSLSQIIDSSGNVWTVVGAQVYVNGTLTVSSSVVLLLYYNGLIYQENSSGGWYQYTGGTAYVQVAGDPRGTSGAPAPAAALGFNTLTFSSTKVVVQGSAPGNFYAFALDGQATQTGYTANANGSLTMTSGVFNATVCSCGKNLAKTNGWEGTAFAGGEYYEFIASFPGSPSGNPVSIWLSPIEKMAPTNFGTYQWPGQGGNYSNYGEFDLIEAYTNGDASHFKTTTLHWYGPGFGGYIQNDQSLGWVNIPLPTGTTWANPQKIGVLRVPATATTPGYAQTYVNGNIVQVNGSPVVIQWNAYNASLAPPPVITNTSNGGCSPNSFFSVNDSQHWGLIMGCTNSANALTVTQMNVWQASAANNLSQ